MTRVYLSEQGSVGHARRGRMEVEKDGMRLLALPLEQVEQVVVVGCGVQLSMALVIELLRRGIEIAFISQRGGYYGKAVGAPRGGAGLRESQYRHLNAEATARMFAADLVGEKIMGQARHLERFPAAWPAAAAVRRLASRLPAQRTVDQVRGIEGAAAARYWRAIAALVPAEWGFAGRRHFPAPDPLNALLSFAYTLLLGEIVTNVHLVGLDATLGALHAPDGSRPSLALDLEEPLRPLGVDIWVVEALLDNVFAVGHFQQEDARLLLTAEGRRRFLSLYDAQMERRVRHPLAPGRIRMRQALALHVRQAAQLFGGGRERWEAIEWP